jgi:long-subunit acyl-CoA synthetase (AMP-forming)/pyrroloquinoline quinone (PQQ) biosynthesis protein C
MTKHGSPEPAATRLAQPASASGEAARPALDDGRRAWRAFELGAAVEQAAHLLRQADSRVVATALDNGAAFVVLDEATRRAGVVHVPLPLFFTADQVRHALQAAGVDTLVTAPDIAVRWPGLPWQPVEVAGDLLMRARLPATPTALPAGTVKITFTSGTTGSPKGVCLSGDALDGVARGLTEALAPLAIERHLCALPFAVLLENIAGLMAPRRHGATVLTRPLADLGLQGSSRFDAARFHAAVVELQPHSLILLPQMLRAWCAHLVQHGLRAPESLRIVAVGGAAVGEGVIRTAHALDIPACEGYGLSEGASVQTLNLPGADRPGSAGRALPHARLRVNAGGEIEIGGTLFCGYLGGDGQPGAVPAWWPTGDLGHIDADGHLHVHGRRKHVLITAFGRNVSPEWVETALRSCEPIVQAVVLGDGQAVLSAVLWPLSSDASDEALQAAVNEANAGLPDYARIGRWVRASSAFDTTSGFATANGRPQRAAILAGHAHALGLPASSHAPTLMSFHDRLLTETESARQELLGTPIIQGALAGRVSVPSYIAFLTEAYHHVRHTVSLLQAARAGLRPHQAWLQDALDEYIDEEAGHDEWILGDIAACGGDAEAVRHGRPAHATEVMVAYAYDTIARVNPVAFFGMVLVLEGTSVSLALMAADAIQKPLGLPDAAFTYLRSHGTLDREHTATFALLMDQLDDPGDQADIVHAARAFYRLYGDVFRSLPLPQAEAVAA